jgi:exo-beta-1,3-glucanase (GH17 family)
MYKALFLLVAVFVLVACSNKRNAKSNGITVTAATILGNNAYQAICYGGYRTTTREVVPTVEEIKEDLKILSALNFKLLRTYNVHRLEIDNLLEAITQLKKEQSDFEMYVMLGVWIDCKNAWTTKTPIHTEESEANVTEVAKAVKLANQYPEIIKIIAVGNEAMVNWAAAYYVTPDIILKWVTHLQNLKKENKLSKDIWITSSDNFASWGGGGKEYHVPALEALIKSVDYISLHTYPMHDTHYNPAFWGIKESEQHLTDSAKISAAMLRARDYAINQYNSVVAYMKSVGVNKPVHIGETGWATMCNELYGKDGSKGVDEYKSALYYKLMRDWSNANNTTCFYFEAFDENWKNSSNPLHSENHFGLINLQSEAKYAIWNEVDKGVFKGLTRNGKPITKTYNGNKSMVLQQATVPAKLLKD